VAGVLAALVAVRVLLPLLVLAASGSALPGFPEYTYEPRPGDAHGYHAAMRELLATGPRLGLALPVAAAAVVLLVVALVRARRRPQERAVLAVVAAACVALVATLLVLRMRASGAVTIGWPLVWSVPLLPYRLAGRPLDPDVAFGFGLALSLLANAVTVVATYLLGLWSSGRRAVGLVAAALFGLWPLLLPLVGKTSDLGTWQNDLGLSVYSEPLSTALVASGGALLVRPGRGPLAEIVAGVLMGFSTTVRLSNALIAGCAAAVLVVLARRSALRFAVGAAVFAPVVIAYWPLGYPMLPPEQFPDDTFGLEYAVPAWRDSTVWGLRAFVALVPLAVVGALTLRRVQAALLVLWVASTAALYTFYSFTPLHPRFLFVALPPLFVLWAAGAAAAYELARRRYERVARVTSRPNARGAG
jgi:hypothetical protein